MERKRVLIIDDEPANLQKLKRTLMGEFEVREASTGEEALRLLNEGPWEAIITDQRMPGLRGVDVLRESIRLNPDAVRIILTGFTDVEDLIGAINEGQVDRYLVKPWDPFSLKHALHQELERRELRRENHRLKEELRIAREVQSRLFPNGNPLLRRGSCTGICRPAWAVGGDYFDFVPLDENRLCLVLGDVSGKGISAALLMANLQALVRSHLEIHPDSPELLTERINRFLCAWTDDNRFATFFCGIYDDQEGTLTYVNAGHLPPLRVSSGGSGDGNEEPSILRLPSGGPVLGILPDVNYSASTVALKPGDLLVLFSDGVTECQNLEGRFFGEERLIRLVTRHRQRSPDELIQVILKEVDQFSQGLAYQDDVTLVVLRAG